ncbi:tol-pal system protein YbgF [Defluviimonas sp. WL0024]|uniref:Cell division coordinator CpoB n=1 Tax=Albidovulum salinarum TaxID=2984153 RepID=A0ABT2X073_9RHOB|nr:tol-pal system protein YbgF [Defluviimonas sp. WL0024]MCU9847323.1 tol-pal system protein YbgF [Defluviimonas sp. WL0024]
MIRSFVTSLAAAAVLAAPAFAQDRAQTLADIRAELSALAGQIQALRGELVSGGAAAMQAAGGASALDRMNAMEAELSRLTSQTEALQNQVNRVVADGSNRIGDLEFRICELEEGCDPANLPITQSLGGAPAGAVAAAPATPVTPLPVPGTGGSAELAVSEQADFDRAKAALDSGDFQGAAQQFATFTEAYTGGPLTGEAHYLRGEALRQAGDTSNAARAYLQAFSGQPDGPRAPAALLKLGASLGLLGQTQEACVTLGEVGVRFPTAPEAVEATTAMQALGCQ